MIFPFKTHVNNSHLLNACYVSHTELTISHTFYFNLMTIV